MGKDEQGEQGYDPEILQSWESGGRVRAWGTETEQSRVSGFGRFSSAVVIIWKTLESRQEVKPGVQR